MFDTGNQTEVGREVVHELGRLYRQVRRGNVDTFEGFRWASILGIIGSVSNTTRTASPSCPRLSTASVQRSPERPGTYY
jgi:hypothetical protein